MTSGVTPPIAARRTAERTGARSQNATFQDNVLLAMWILLLFEPDWFLSAFGGGAVLKRIPTLLLPVLIVCTATRWRRQGLYWPFIGIMAIHIVHMPLVENRGLLMHGFESLYLFFFVFVASACMIRSADHTLRLLTLFMLHFLWYGVQGAASGRVGWHSMISNEDSFGPLMGIGLGYCYYYAQSIRDRNLRWLAYATAGVCVVGVVSSLARGAVLSAGLVMGLIWLRSPRKIATLAGGIAAAIVGLTAITVVHPENAFWKEMSTVSEGNKAGTGLERWVMWNISLEVFKKKPLLGAGPNNVGAVAYRIIPYDPERPQYADPVQLYNKKLHNIFLQILSEQGLVGSAIWLAMVTDFFLRLRRLRRPSSVAYWRQATSGRLDVSMLSLGLECAMVGYLANGFFYNQIYIHWFWTLCCLAYVLTINTGRPRRRSEPAPRSGAPGSQGDSGMRGEERREPEGSARGSSLGKSLIAPSVRGEADSR